MLFNGRALIFTFSRTQVRIAEIERLQSLFKTSMAAGETSSVRITGWTSPPCLPSRCTRTSSRAASLTSTPATASGSVGRLPRRRCPAVTRKRRRRWWRARKPRNPESRSVSILVLFRRSIIIILLQLK